MLYNLSNVIIHLPKMWGKKAFVTKTVMNYTFPYHKNGHLLFWAMQNSDKQNLSIRVDQFLLHIYEDVPKLEYLHQKCQYSIVANQERN